MSSDDYHLGPAAMKMIGDDVAAIVSPETTSMKLTTIATLTRYDFGQSRLRSKLERPQ